MTSHPSETSSQIVVVNFSEGSTNENSMTTDVTDKAKPIAREEITGSQSTENITEAETSFQATAQVVVPSFEKNTKLDRNDESIVLAQARASRRPLLICTLTIFLHGMGCGAASAYCGLVLEDHLTHTALVTLSPTQAAWMVSLTPLSFGAGTLLCIPITEVLGRKTTLMLGNLISLFSFMAVFVVPAPMLLLVALTMKDIGMGISDMVGGVYLSEISTVHHRGLLSGANMTSNTAGILVYTGLSNFLPAHYLALTFVIHQAIVVALILPLPKSPHCTVWYSLVLELLLLVSQSVS